MLISDQYVAKISDFGLARDVYDNLEYVKVTPVSNSVYLFKVRISGLAS